MPGTQRRGPAGTAGGPGGDPGVALDKTSSDRPIEPRALVDGFAIGRLAGAPQEIVMPEPA